MKRSHPKRGTQAEYERFVRKLDLRTQRAIRKLQRTRDVDEFADRFAQILEDGHLGAVWRGRILAGDRSKIDDLDRRFAREIADSQAEFLQDFLDKIEAGGYTDEDGKFSEAGIKNRCRYYLERLRGTANEALVAYSDEEEDWFWDLGVAEHCEDCIALHRASPLKASQLWTQPGRCETECRSKCKCRLRRGSDGTTGFGFVSLYQKQNAQTYVLNPKPALSEQKPAARAG